MAPVPHRDFDARPSTAPAASGTLQLGGRTWKIRARSDVPYELLRQLISDDNSPDPDDQRTPAELTPAEREERRQRVRRVLVQTDEFFASTIVADQVDDFLALVHDKGGPFSLEKSQEVATYISECLFSEKGPTIPSRPSRRGRAATTGSTSKAGSSSRGTQRARSAS